MAKTMNVCDTCGDVHLASVPCPVCAERQRLDAESGKELMMNLVGLLTMRVCTCKLKPCDVLMPAAHKEGCPVLDDMLTALRANK